MMLRILLLLLFVTFIETKILANIVNNFISIQERPAAIISFLKDNHKLAKGLTNTISVKKWLTSDLQKDDHNLFIADLNENNTNEILTQAVKLKLTLSPNRWLLTYELKNITLDEDMVKNEIEFSLINTYIGINTEIYVVIFNLNEFSLYSVYKINPNFNIIWTPYNMRCIDSLAIRRNNVAVTPVVVSTVVTNNDTLTELDNYLNRQSDTLTKYPFYMMKHLADFVNGTFVMNITNTWGYIQQDGRFNGMMREIEDNRADIGGTTFVPTESRLRVVEFVLPPADMGAYFLFKKPSLGSITNIYTLPFSLGVWYTIILLICLFSLALFVTYCREYHIIELKKSSSKSQTLLDGIQDALCLVFQQGTVTHPVFVSTRQVLLLGLITFMFLFTAYSANVVSLLQTTANDINNVETLLKSPLKLGLQDVVYNKHYFPTDTRQYHKAIWEQKLEPQGDKAIYDIKDGIRKVRESMFAFHVESTAGYDEIQKTFRDNEKCNIGQIKFMAMTAPYLGISRDSRIKEQLKIGARRIMESGIQDRSTRRVIVRRPTCHVNVAMFSAVTLSDVAPAFKWLFLSYTTAIILIIIEIIANSQKFNEIICCTNKI